MAGLPGTRPAPDLPPGPRAALVIATASYQDSALSQLRATADDAQALTDVLDDPGIGGFTVTSVIDADEREARRMIDLFLSGRDTADVVLVYLSCHGVLDRRNRLYFAAADTVTDHLSATGISAAWLLEQLEECRARQQVVTLDCCFSGAFANGSKGDNELDLERRLSGSGRGRAILTASRSGEYSFTGDALSGATISGSLFTAGLVEGLRTGAADTGGDGYITVDEAYDFVYRYVLSLGAAQTPQRWLSGGEGAIVLARSPAGIAIRAATLPEELADALESRYPTIRIGAVHELGTWLAGDDPGRALTAEQKLRQIADNDNHTVATAARAYLAAPGQAVITQANASSADPSGPSGTQPMDRWHWASGRDVWERALVLGAELGAGGHGRVFRLSEPQPGLVYKQYKPNVRADPVALKSLVDFPRNLRPQDRERLYREAAWPLARVLRDGGLAGILMRETPTQFVGQNAGGNRKLREIQYLLHEPKPLWGDIVPLEVDGRLEICRKIAAFFDLLHENSVVMGDVSSSNMLWSPGDPPEIYTLDCDTARILGASPSLPHAESLDWDYPLTLGTGGPDLNSDRYKLALLIGRILSRSAHIRPGEDIPLVRGIPNGIAAQVKALWERADLTRGTRPPAASLWAEALDAKGGPSLSYADLGPRAQQVLPFYLVCEESDSMSGASVAAVNQSLQELHMEIGSNPMLADRVRFCLIGYSDEARVLQSLVDLSSVSSLPGLHASGGVSYAPAFDLLRETIASDVAALRSQGNLTYRPAVFFMTASQPTDDWASSFQRLTDPGWRLNPNILAFGFGNAGKETLEQIATVKAFVGDGSVGPNQALREFAQQLIQSIVNSGARPAVGGGLTLVIPHNVPGFTSLPPDYI